MGLSRKSEEAEVSVGGWSLGRLLGGGGLGWAYKFQEGWDGGEDEGDLLSEMGLPNLRG